MTFRTGISTSFGTQNDTRCPVCGDPGSNCTGDGPPIVNVLMQDQASDDKIIIRVEEDVVREIEISEGNKVSEVVAAAGSYISKAQAKQLGILP